jgi:nicotinate-nucleotide pyrophosphorylase (carboxylating)
MVLIKDNHVDAAGGITQAVNRVLAYLEKEHINVPIEVETRSLEEVKECLVLPIHRIMLDNFRVSAMQKAVSEIGGRMEVEASGNIDLDRVRRVAETGVDFISVGALTHSAKSLDISLVIQRNPSSA